MADDGKKINVRRLVGGVVVCVMLLVAANVTATAIFVLRSSDARSHNCGIVREAFDRYTDALIAVGTDGKDLTAKQEAEVAAFRRSVSSILNDCR